MENRSLLERKKKKEKKKKRNISYNKIMGHCGLIKCSLILSANDTKCFWQWKGE